MPIAAALQHRPYVFHPPPASLTEPQIEPLTEHLAALAHRTRLGTACFHARHAHGIKSLQVEHARCALHEGQ